MSVQTRETQFWRWLLKDHFLDFDGLRPDQTTITGYENIFIDEERFDLTIDLEAGECRDSDQNQYGLTEFMAVKGDITKAEAEHELDVEYARWQEQEKARQEKMKFIRDAEHMCWKKRTGEDSFEEVTDFDIILTSITEKYDLKQDEWQRSYEVTLRYKRLGKIVATEVTLEPADTHTKDNFSNAVWEKGIMRVKNLKRGEMRDFWFHLDAYYKPRTVREYEYYGFIEFEGEKYFLAENVLVKFPKEHGQPLELIAQQDGAFPVKENKYVKPPEEAIHLPRFDLGVSQNGMYQQSMNKLLGHESFERNVKKVEHHFCKMVGSDTKYSQWGKLIMGYVFSYLFFDDIYDHFKHIIFLYFYGDGNVGKGEAVKRILDFYGINYLDSLNTPPPRSVDEALEEKSQIPQWIDEHVPDVPGKDPKTADQTWNSWFELKMRRTNIRKGDSWGAERKAVRTMPVFCSNFKPKTDHLLSRCIILEYKKSHRGPEQHVQWLKREKDLLQLLMLSFMQNYNLMDRKAFVWNLDRIRNKLKAEVKTELKKQSGNAILQDRQISQFATLLTVYHWLRKGYRDEITRIARESEKIAAEEDETYRQIQQEQMEADLSSLLDADLYQFVKEELIKSAVVAAQHDPLTEYIDTIGTLIQAGEIHEGHFNWTDDGHLKIWAKAVWDIYLKNKRGTEDIVRRETVEEKLKEMSRLNSDGSLKTINWTRSDVDQHSPKRTVRCKGFYIDDAYKSEVFRLAFNIERFGPPLSQLGNAEDQQESANQQQREGVQKPMDLDDEPPF